MKTPIHLCLFALLTMAAASWAADSPTTTTLPFRAAGTEPFWQIVIDKEKITLSTPEDATAAVVSTPAAEETKGTIRYAVKTAEHNLVVTISPAICRDAMSGMPYPSSVQVELDGKTMKGCGGNPRQLLLGSWQVEKIGQDKVIAGSQVTLELAEDGGISGAASCNRYFGKYNLTGEGITFSKLGSTRMACEPDLMKQEQAFLQGMETITRFDLDEDGRLILYSGDDPALTAKRK